MNAVKIAAIALIMAAAGLGWSPSGILQVHSDQGMRYVSDSEGKRTEINALSNPFNLRLLSAMPGSGEYLSAVRMSFQDAQRQTAHIDGLRQSRRDFTGVESGHLAVGVRSTSVQNKHNFRSLQNLCAIEHILTAMRYRVPLCSLKGEVSSASLGLCQDFVWKCNSM